MKSYFGTRASRLLSLLLFIHFSFHIIGKYHSCLLVYSPPPPSHHCVIIYPLFVKAVKYAAVSSVSYFILLLSRRAQPDAANKQSIVHILGLLSSLFTTLDINRQPDDSEAEACPRFTSSGTTPNPVSSGTHFVA